jgi:hypothetical protein
MLAPDASMIASPRSEKEEMLLALKRIPRLSKKARAE